MWGHVDRLDYFLELDSDSAAVLQSQVLSSLSKELGFGRCRLSLVSVGVDNLNVVRAGCRRTAGDRTVRPLELVIDEYLNGVAEGS